MRRSTGLGVGSFLIALGIGWYLFTTYEVTFDVVAWILVLLGSGIIVASLFTWRWPRLQIGGLVGGIIGGLILSLILTSGSGIVNYFIGGDVGPYRAEETQLFSGLLTEHAAYLEIDNFNGPIRVTTHTQAHYNLSVKIKARGTSQQQAEDYLEDFEINLAESVIEDQKRIILTYNVPSFSHSRYSVEVEVKLPRDTLLDLNLDSSNGGIYLKHVTGDVLQLETSNGDIVLDHVVAERITGTSSNGGIEGEIEAPQTTLSTSNGAIEVAIPSTRSGEYILGTSNGPIRLMVSPSTDVGYDLDLSTSNGEITINLSNLNYSQNQRTRKEATTIGFDDKPVQVVLQAETSNSDVDIIVTGQST